MVSPSIIILKCKSSTHISPLSASPPHLHRHHSSLPIFTLLPVKYSDYILSLSAQFTARPFLGNQFDSPIALVINLLGLIEVYIMAIERGIHQNHAKGAKGGRWSVVGGR